MKACFSISIRLGIPSLRIADYNTARPHSSLGYKTPAAYADHLTATGHRAPLHEGSARWPVAYTAPNGVTTAEVLIAAG
jgi:hypothetical protein